jgi:hypothetical protein
MQKGGGGSSGSGLGGGGLGGAGLGSSLGAGLASSGAGNSSSSHAKAKDAHDHHSGSSSTSNSSKEKDKDKDGHGHGIASQFNDFLKSTFSFGDSSKNNRSSSSATSPKSNKSGSSSNNQAVSPNTATPTANPFFNQQSSSNNVDSLNADMAAKLAVSGSGGANIPNCARVLNSYTAITEDEISVLKGDLVQIVTANMHNRFMVHREANEHQPAAEGWIPGHVIGFQSTSLPNGSNFT